MGSERSWIGRAHLTRWMQALGLVYVLMFLPVRGCRSCGRREHTDGCGRHGRRRRSGGTAGADDRPYI